MPIDATLSTPTSAYRTSHFPARTEVEIQINLASAPRSDLTQGHLQLWDTQYSRWYGGFPVPSNLWSLEKVSDTFYTVRYTSDFPVTNISLVLRHSELTLTNASLTISVGPIPQPVTFDVDKEFLFSGETATVSFFVNLIGRTVSVQTLSLSAGTFTNFSGSDGRYRVDITAPSAGFGLIQLSIQGYPGVFEEILYAPRPTEDIVFVGKKKPDLHLSRGDKTVYFQEITESSLDDLNDFSVLVLFDKDATGFTENDMYVQAINEANDIVPSSIVDFRGKGSVYEVTLRVLSTGGSGTVVITVPVGAVDQGNPEKVIVIRYDDEIVIPNWDILFVTAETYNDIVSVSRDSMQLLRDRQIDFYSLSGVEAVAKRVKLPQSPVVTRAVKYDEGKYLGLSTASDSKAHLFVAEALEWSSDSVFTLSTDRHTASSSEIRGLAVNDWVWTRDRRVILASSPYSSNAASIAEAHSLEIHKAIREGSDLNDVVFDEISVDYGDLNVDSWNGLVAVAADEGRLFVGSNETGSNEQNYIFVFDAENKIVPGQQIPITGRVKSLFVKDGWLYRYNETAKAVMRFPLDVLRLPVPKQKIYPQVVLPGAVINLQEFVRYAERIVFDVGFEKPAWLSIASNKLRIASDAPVKSTAYVRLRAINVNGASVAGSFGFYVYVRELRSPRWLDFEKLSIYHNQKLNMHAYVEDADEIQWQEGFNVPPEISLADGVLSIVPTVPVRVTGLVLSAENREIAATWDRGVATAGVLRAEVSLDGGAWEQADALTWHVFRNLVNGRTYRVRVRYVNAVGPGAASASVSAMPQALPAVPPQPSGVSVLSRNRRLILSWTLLSAFPALEKMQVRHATSEAGLSDATWADVGAAVTSYDIRSLTNGVRYYAQVRGVNSEGNGPASVVVSGVPNPIPAVPSVATGFSLVAGDNQLTASWTLPFAFPALEKMQIRWAETQTGLASATWTDLAATATSYDITGLVDGTTYFVQVRGVNAEGNGPATTAMSARPRGAPQAQQSITLTAGNQQITVRWTLGNSFPVLTSQRIRWATSSAGLAIAAWTDLTPTATQYTIMNLSNDVEVFVQLQARNADGDSPITDEVSAMPTSLVPPAKVTGLSRVSSTSENAEISWDALANISHYEYRVRSVLRFTGRDFFARTFRDWTSTESTATTATVALDTRASGALTLVNQIQVRGVNATGKGPASDVLEI